MARNLRKFGNQRKNHIIIRGVNKQDIFLDKQDKKKFVDEMKKLKEKFHYELYAYVLMPNHVHMQIYDKEENLPEIMHSLQIRYASYFNKKYERIGHLFQDRYKNKIIESENYFFNTIRYIHSNPEKAFIANMEQYQWSSYNAYIRNDNELVDVDMFLDMLDKNRNDAIEKFKQFHKENEENEMSNYIEYELRGKLTDDELIEFLKKKWNMDSVQNIQQYNNEIIKSLISEVITESYISSNQLARITGVNRKLIAKLKK